MSTAADKPVRHILSISGGKPAPYFRAFDMLDPILTRHYPQSTVGGSRGASQGRGHVLQVAEGGVRTDGELRGTQSCVRREGQCGKIFLYEEMKESVKCLCLMLHTKC